MDTKKSTSNNSGTRERDMVLPQTERNRERATMVNGMLERGEATTRRQARKMIQRREGRR